MIWTKTFWKGAGERAVKTWFQVFVAMTMLTAGTEMIPAVGIEGIPTRGKVPPQPLLNPGFFVGVLFGIAL